MDDLPTKTETSIENTCTSFRLTSGKSFMRFIILIQVSKGQSFREIFIPSY